MLGQMTKCLFKGAQNQSMLLSLHLKLLNLEVSQLPSFAHADQQILDFQLLLRLLQNSVSHFLVQVQLHVEQILQAQALGGDVEHFVGVVHEAAPVPVPQGVALERLEQRHGALEAVDFALELAGHRQKLRLARNVLELFVKLLYSVGERPRREVHPQS